MKVLMNNASNPIDDKKVKNVNEIEVECTECGSKLIIIKDDLREYHFGGYVFNCPCCGDYSYVDDKEAITLGNKLITIDDVKFPIHFSTTLDKEDGVDVKRNNDDQIEKFIKSLVNSLRESNENDDTIRYTECGDTFIAVQRFDGDEEYAIVVAKDPYITKLKFNDKDYMLMDYRNR